MSFASQIKTKSNVCTSGPNGTLRIDQNKLRNDAFFSLCSKRNPHLETLFSSDNPASNIQQIKQIINEIHV